MISIRKYAAISLVVVSILAIGISLIFVGSPSQARLERYDQQRVADLQNLQNGIMMYASGQYHLNQQTKPMLNPLTNLLPPDLSAVTKQSLGIEFFTVDPITKQAYEYRRIDDAKYELCATFDTVMVTGGDPDPISSIWDHPAGRHCFSLTIDPTQFTVDQYQLKPPYPIAVPAPLPQ